MTLEEGWHSSLACGWRMTVMTCGWTSKWPVRVCVGLYMLQILRFRRVANTRHSWRCVSKIRSVGQESLAARGVRFGALTAHWGTCYCHWRPGLQVFIAGGCGALLCGWFHQVKVGFARIWKGRHDMLERLKTWRQDSNGGSVGAVWCYGV